LPAYQEEQPGAAAQAVEEDEQKLRKPAEEPASNLPGRSSTARKNIITNGQVLGTISKPTVHNN